MSDRIDFLGIVFESRPSGFTEPELIDGYTEILGKDRLSQDFWAEILYQQVPGLDTFHSTGEIPESLEARIVSLLTTTFHIPEQHRDEALHHVRVRAIELNGVLGFLVMTRYGSL